ncbi:RAMP superfamily CRISPR-associated protein [Methylomagnum sp.]
MKPHYLFLGTLVQEASASFGGQEAEGWVDEALCRDGKGRYTLRGEGQAGALLSMARKLFRGIPHRLGGVMTRQPSAWRTYTTHPELDSLGEAELRQCVRIDPKTAAADEGALFDLETLPPGTRWPFLLELDASLLGEGEGGRATAITAHVLQAWANGYAWFGRGVARGLGWFKLDHPRVLTLSETDVWPNAFTASPFAYAAELAAGRAEPLANFIGQQTIRPDGTWRWRTYDLTLSFGDPDPEGYDGLGALSIGSHAGYDATPPYPEGQVIWPDGLENHARLWKPDRFVTATGAKPPLPYIPGSSLRGPLRHRLAWWLNRQGRTDTEFETLFGYVKEPNEDRKQTEAKSSALLIRDAFPEPKEGWRMALLQSHAEDEFSAGTCGVALYNRLAVMSASFQTRVVLEAPSEAKLIEMDELFKAAQKLATLGFVPIGGATRHGFGRGRWEFKEAKAQISPPKQEGAI